MVKIMTTSFCFTVNVVTLRLQLQFVVEEMQFFTYNMKIKADGFGSYVAQRKGGKGKTPLVPRVESRSL